MPDMFLMNNKYTPPTHIDSSQYLHLSDHPTAHPAKTPSLSMMYWGKEGIRRRQSPIKASFYMLIISSPTGSFLLLSPTGLRQRSMDTRNKSEYDNTDCYCFYLKSSLDCVSNRQGIYRFLKLSS